MSKLTQDCILNGKIKLLQPENGYRVAIDPILLSNFVEPKPGQKILDAGCGVGAISLILKTKEPLSEITAIDLDEEMCKVCAQNSRLNSLDINVINSGIENIGEVKNLKDKSFHHVVTNPPFFEKKSSRISPTKRFANFETIELSAWISFCLKKLQNGGEFSIIHKASRVGDILQTLGKSIGAIEIIFVFPKAEGEAKRVIVRGKKGSKTETKILPPFVVHNEDGSYTKTVREILSGSFQQFSR